MNETHGAPPVLRGALEALDRVRTRCEVFVRRGETEQLRRDAAGTWETRASSETGVACRLATRGQAGFAAAAGASARVGAAAGATALDMLVPAPDPLPTRDRLGITAIHPAARTADPARRRAFAETVAAQVAAVAPTVELIELRVLEGRATSWIATGEGFSARTDTAAASVELVLAPPEGPWRLFHVAAASIHDLDPERIAERATGAALLATRGSPPRRHLTDALLSPAVAAPLVVALVRHMSGAARGNEPTPRARISPLWHLTDERPGPHGLMPTAFDGEGLPSRRIELLRDGRQGERLGTWADALRLGISPGGAVRPSYRQRPFAGPANLVVHPVRALPQPELLAGLEHGYYLNSPAGSLQLDGESGRFRLRVAAVAVEHGRPVATHPLVEVRGSLRRLLSGLAATGSDLESLALSCAVTTPSLLVHRLEVA